MIWRKRFDEEPQTAAQPELLESSVHTVVDPSWHIFHTQLFFSNTLKWNTCDALSTIKKQNSNKTEKKRQYSSILLWYIVSLKVITVKSNYDRCKCWALHNQRGKRIYSMCKNIKLKRRRDAEQVQGDPPRQLKDRRGSTACRKTVRQLNVSLCSLPEAKTKTKTAIPASVRRTETQIC